MIRINLLPVRAAQKKEKLISQVVVLILALVGAAAICIALQTMLSSKIEDYQADIKQADREIAQLNKKIGEVDKIKKLTADLEKKRKVLADLEAGRSGPVRLLDQLSQSIPEKVWINDLTVKGPSVKITGAGLTAEDVAVFLRALEESPYYKNITLGEIKDSKQGNTFNLTCQVETPPAK